MSNNGFTTGPWRAERREVRPDRAGNGERRVWWVINSGEVAVADITYPHSSRPRDEHEANARLIAAAPELYEACKAALAAFDWCDGGGIPAEQQVINLLREAVKQAEEGRAAGGEG